MTFFEKIFPPYFIYPSPPPCTNANHTAAVLISLEEYNSIRATEDLISTGTTPAEVEKGIAALVSGSCIPVNIDEL
ncbi:MAG: hypothetical protein MJY80_07655 [Bacteroidales bacterium]|nr:hypothetical protein [Bacteroidales bacterium]